MANLSASGSPEKRFDHCGNLRTALQSASAQELYTALPVFSIFIEEVIWQPAHFTFLINRTVVAAMKHSGECGQELHDAFLPIGKRPWLKSPTDWVAKLSQD